MERKYKQHIDLHNAILHIEAPVKLHEIYNLYTPGAQDLMSPRACDIHGLAVENIHILAYTPGGLSEQRMKPNTPGLPADIRFLFIKTGT